MALFIELLLRDLPRSFVQIEFCVLKQLSAVSCLFSFFQHRSSMPLPSLSEHYPRCLLLMLCVSTQVRLLIRVDVRHTELMYYSSAVCICVHVDCPHIIPCICIMFHSLTEHFHVSHLTHTAALWG